MAGETAEARRKRIELADADSPNIAAELSQMLLGPVVSKLSSKRLLIVGDGKMQYLPFAALPVPLAANGQGGGLSAAAPPSIGESQLPTRPPLVVEHEIVNLPSASVLGVLRTEAAGRQTAEKTVAVFADPVFDGSDSRVRRTGPAAG